MISLLHYPFQVPLTFKLARILYLVGLTKSSFLRSLSWWACLYEEQYLFMNLYPWHQEWGGAIEDLWVPVILVFYPLDSRDQSPANAVTSSGMRRPHQSQFQSIGTTVLGSGESTALNYLNQLIWRKRKHKFWRIIRYNLRGAPPTFISWFTDIYLLLCKYLLVLGSKCTLHPSGRYHKLSEYCLPAGTWANLFFNYIF